MGTQRFAYVAQLACMSELGDLDKTLDFMLELRSNLTSFLALLEAAETEALSAGEDVDDEAFHDYLTLRMGVTSIQARIAWCDETRERILERQRAIAAKEKASA